MGQAAANELIELGAAVLCSTSLTDWA